jgi:hypothetical protein
MYTPNAGAAGILLHINRTFTMIKSEKSEHTKEAIRNHKKIE